MVYAKPLIATLALLALAGCGDDTPTAQSGAAQQQAAAPEAAEKTTAVKVAKAEPAPDPIDAIITFKGEDGVLELERADLEMISPVQDTASEGWSVFVQMDEDSAMDFYDLTTKTTGEALSIMVGDMIVSTPVLDAPVYGGGFVFNVENGNMAGIVVAKLKGEAAPVPVATAVSADDALPKGEAEGDAVADAQEAE